MIKCRKLFVSFLILHKIHVWVYQQGFTGITWSAHVFVMGRRACVTCLNGLMKDGEKLYPIHMDLFMGHNVYVDSVNLFIYHAKNLTRLYLFPQKHLFRSGGPMQSVEGVK